MKLMLVALSYSLLIMAMSITLAYLNSWFTSILRPPLVACIYFSPCFSPNSENCNLVWPFGLNICILPYLKSFHRWNYSESTICFTNISDQLCSLHSLGQHYKFSHHQPFFQEVSSVPLGNMLTWPTPFVVYWYHIFCKKYLRSC